ncbi:MAG: hypothetical protein JWO46_1552, partial [Nocardioidaceae bacterium]|nr:hypothetical protein [Nocardioidaceae bacterium]
GRTLTTLKKTGQYDNTIVVFTSDNGYFLGEHRRPQGKILVHEPSLRVPFLIAGPGIPHGERYDPVTTIDLAPTFATYAGLPGMPDQDGLPLQNVIQNGDQGWAAPVVTEGLVGNKLYYGNFSQPAFDSLLNVRGIRTATWKYTKYSTGEVELYDLTKDPLELNSLQNDPAYAAVMARMDKLWTRYYRCVGAQCQEPLPKDLQATPAQEKQVTDNETAMTEQYYDTPPNQK